MGKLNSGINFPTAAMNAVHVFKMLQGTYKLPVSVG